MSEKRQIIDDLAKQFIGTFGASAINLSQNLFLAGIFGPSVFGIWNLLMVIYSYGLHGHLGLIHGMGKEIPTLRGMGERGQAKIVEDVAFTAVCIIGVFIGLMVFLSSFFAWGEGFESLTNSLKILSGVMLLNQTYIFLVSVLRNDKKFGLLSTATFLLPAIVFVLIILEALTGSLSLNGALWAIFTSNLLAVTYIFLKDGYECRIRWNLGLLSHLFKVGFPLILLALGFSFFWSVDRWVIGKTFSTQYLGYYGLGMMLVGGLYSVPAVLASVLYPRMLESYGRSRSFTVTGLWTYKPTIVVSYFMTWVTGILALTAPQVIHYLLPEYVPGIVTIDILIMGSFFVSTIPIFSNYLISINYQNVLLKMQWISVCLILGIDFTLIKLGFTLAVIAAGTVTVYAFYGTTVLYVGFNAFLGDRRKSLSTIAGVYLIFLSGMGVCLFLFWLFPVTGKSFGLDFALTVFRLVLFTLFLLSFYPYINRKTRISEQIGLMVPLIYRP